LVSRKLLVVEVLCLVGILLLLDSALRTLFVLGIGTGTSPYYVGLAGAFAPFDNVEGIVGTILAMNPLFILAFTRVQA